MGGTTVEGWWKFPDGSPCLVKKIFLWIEDFQ